MYEFGGSLRQMHTETDNLDTGYKRKRKHQEVESDDDEDIFRIEKRTKRCDRTFESSYRQYVPPRKFKPSSEFCKHCGQSSDMVVLCPNPPEEAFSEEELLGNSHLRIIDESKDEKPQFKLTNFSVFDEKNHLCPFYGSLIEKAELLYFHGHVGAIDSNKAGFPSRDIGPITEWWIVVGAMLIGFSTEAADYFLEEPDKCYAPFMSLVYDQAFLLKSIVDVLQDDLNPSDVSYETLLKKLSEIQVPPERCSLNDYNLLKHADFICNQLLDLDSNASPDDVLLFDSQCISTLISRGGVDISREKTEKTRKKRTRKFFTKTTNKVLSKATTTSLVSDLFEDYLPEQINRSVNEGVRLKSKLKPFVITLTNFEDSEWSSQNKEWKPDENARLSEQIDRSVNEDVRLKSEMKSFVIKLTRLEDLGWSSQNKEWKPDENAHLKLSSDIVLKNFTINLKRLSDEEVEKYSKNITRLRKPILTDSESESEDVFVSKTKKKSCNSSANNSTDDESYTDTTLWSIRSTTTRRNKKLFVWLDVAMVEVRKKTYYRAIDLGDCELKVSQFITTFSSDRVALVRSMWENNRNEKMLHVQWFMLSSQTIMGASGTKRELFWVDECDDIYMDDVKDIVDVTIIHSANSADEMSDLLQEWINPSLDIGKNKFFCQKR